MISSLTRFGGVHGQRPTQGPREAVDLYTRYIHGEINRRDFLSGLSRFAVAGLTVERDRRRADAQLRCRRSRCRRPTSGSRPATSPCRRRRATAASRAISCVRSARTRATATPAKLPGILVVHENRGLNPHIEDIARRFALANFMAFAPDALTSVGGYPGDDLRGRRAVRQGGHREEARGLRRQRALAEGAARLQRQDRRRPASATAAASRTRWPCRLGADLAAAAPFYGGAPPAADVPKIKAAILVHHGEADTRLVEAWPAYEAALKAANVPHEGHIYQGRRARLQQRRDARALQQGRRRRGVAAHDRLVQQVRVRA